MESFDKIYSQLAYEVLTEGTNCASRGLNYRQAFGVDFKVDLREQFPLLTLRKLPVKNLLKEIYWDLSGSSKIEELGSAKHFWDFLVSEEDDGYLRGSYGRAWRNYPSNSQLEGVGGEQFFPCNVDQLAYALDQLKVNPTSRRIQVITEMPALSNYAMNPCHPMFIFSSDGNNLDMLVISRSNDIITGLPLDVVRYAAIQKLAARHANLIPRFHKHSIANLHVYDCNIGELEQLIQRDPGESGDLIVNYNKDDVFDSTFTIEGYKPNKAMKFSRDALVG